MSEPEIEARVSVLESKVDDIETEQGLHRSRLHELESDRATLRLLVQQIGEIRIDVKELLGWQAAARALTSQNRFLISTVIALLAVITALVVHWHR